jgi:hypothetical protein
VRVFWREHSLSVVLFGLFALFLLGQALTGYRVFNAEQEQHHSPPIAFSKYLQSGDFGEAVFENWESEFLQMASYIVLTIWLREKGSSESKKISGTEPVDKDPRESRAGKRVPGPVRRGGWHLRIYENSLSLVFAALFMLSISLHAIEGVRQYNHEEREHGQKSISLSEYVRSPQFWFESFQNWQSEFLAVGSLVVLSVYLRQKGSPESKPVDVHHAETGV